MLETGAALVVAAAARDGPLAYLRGLHVPDMATPGTARRKIGSVCVAGRAGSRCFVRSSCPVRPDSFDASTREMIGIDLLSLDTRS